MIQKLLITFIAALAIGTTGTSCSEDIPDCPNTMCVMAGGWKLVEVHVDDELQTTDLSQYRLTLFEPNPTSATTSNFDRIQASGTTDDGTWSIENNDTILRLIPGNDTRFTEDWVIESFTPRQLILVLTRDTDIKEGPGKIRFVLEPL